MRCLKKLFLVTSFLLCSMFLFAQKSQKPVLLVYGHDLTAFSAAIQSAKSGVPTVWILNSVRGFEALVPLGSYHSNLEHVEKDPLQGGLWKEFLVKATKDTVDSVKYAIDLSQSVNILEQMAMSEKNLSVIKNQEVKSFKKGKNDWTVELKNKLKYEVRAVVADIDFDMKRFISDSLYYNTLKLKTINSLSAENSRTIIALLEDKVLTVADALKMQEDNFFVLNSVSHEYTEDFVNSSIRMNLGQAIGATAAYCAFFKTTADKIDIRKLQMELLSFHMRLLPFKDLASTDPNFQGLQKFFLSGIFPFTQKEEKYIFGDSLLVSTSSVKSYFNNLSSRSQLWYADNKNENFNLKDLSSLIKLISFRGDEIDAEIEKDWKKKLKFKSDYQKDKVITRYEFAVLVDKYVNPFVKMVNKEGQVLK